MTQPIAETGVQCDAYLNAGTFAGPAWVLIASARDVTLLNEYTEADASIRGDSGLASTLTGLQKIGADFEILWKPSSPEFALMLACYLGRTPLEFLFLDGPVSGGSGAQGLRMTCLITKFSRKEPLDNSVTADISVRRTISLNPSTWYTA
jgi:hypothetical protein